MNIKSKLSKLNFIIGMILKIEKNINYRNFIPEPYNEVVSISSDFELAWAWRYTKCSSNPLSKALNKAAQERKNVPLILELCEKYNIPITWMTVGHLFLENCSKENGIPHADLPRLAHFENEFWKFEGDDWFEYDSCSNYKDAPEWYAPDLIEMILQSKVKHEIGCHTFSHIDCRDGVCPAGLFEAEVKECQKIAAKFNIELKSFEKLLSFYPDLKLIIAGDSELHFSYNFDKYSNNIKFINKFISSEDLYVLVKNTKLVVCPYTDPTQSE